MIARYSRPEMAQIWEDRNRYLLWLKVELAVCQELAHEKKIPLEEWLELKEKTEKLLQEGGVDPHRVEELEQKTRHDVIAFTTAVAEHVGPVSRYIHFGLTSSDVVDTAFSIQIQEAGSLLIADVKQMLKVLKQKAEEHKALPTIGRSHGISAEPTSFGLKFLGWFTEWERNLERLTKTVENIRYGKLSGAVGVSPHWSPRFESSVLKHLGLKREPVSTQVLPRDRHAEFMNTLAMLGSSLDRIAVELRHLQRSEVGEVMEGFQKGQKGSSAMPHKRNPISSENVSGCARLLRSYAQAAMENVALWHERDISHSSVERVIFPDGTLILDYALRRMSGVLDGLILNPQAIQQNLDKPGSLVFSGHFLLDLVKEGVSREQGYSWIQECALGSLEGKGKFIDLLLKHPEITQKLSEKRIRELGSLQYQLRHVDDIYDWVFSKQEG